MKSTQNWTKEDAVSFIECCMIWIGAGFHPDTQMNDYVDGDGLPAFTDDEARDNQEKLDKAFELLGEDIYECGMELGYKLGYYPRPKDEEAIVQAIEEVKAHIVGDKHIIFRDEPFPKGHLTSVEKPHCYFNECGKFVEVYVKNYD